MLHRASFKGSKGLSVTTAKFSHCWILIISVEQSAGAQKTHNESSYFTVSFTVLTLIYVQ